MRRDGDNLDILKTRPRSFHAMNSAGRKACSRPFRMKPITSIFPRAPLRAIDKACAAERARTVEWLLTHSPRKRRVSLTNPNHGDISLKSFPEKPGVNPLGSRGQKSGNELEWQVAAYSLRPSRNILLQQTPSQMCPC